MPLGGLGGLSGEVGAGEARRDDCCAPSPQVFKFIYSCRLAEMGLATQAFHYCEVIAKSILLQPHKYSPVLISQLVQVTSSQTSF